MTTEKTVDHNQACATGDHDEHLCYLQFKGYHYSNQAEYKELVADAQYLCRNCGRTAARAENLCAPERL